MVSGLLVFRFWFACISFPICLHSSRDLLAFHFRFASILSAGKQASLKQPISSRDWHSFNACCGLCG